MTDLGPPMPPQPFCCVSGTSKHLRPLTRKEREVSDCDMTVSFHHVPAKSLVGHDHDSGVRLDGSGTTGMHGAAERHELDFRYTTRWEWCIPADARTPEHDRACERLRAHLHKLLNRRIERGHWYPCREEE